MNTSENTPLDYAKEQSSAKEMILKFQHDNDLIQNQFLVEQLAHSMAALSSNQTNSNVILQSTQQTNSQQNELFNVGYPPRNA